MIRAVESSANRRQEEPDHQHSGVADLRDAAARWRAPVADSNPAYADLGNVVRFLRTRRDGGAAAAPELSVAARPTVVAAQPHRALWWVTLLLASTAAHVALYLPFGREPPPMTSLGEIAVSVELVLGANQAAGLANDKGESQASSASPAQAPDAVAERPPEPLAAPVVTPEPVTEPPPTPLEIQVQIETPPPEVTERPEPAEKPPEEVATLPPEPAEKPPEQVVAALPPEPEPSPPQPVAPVEATPEPAVRGQVQAAPQATAMPAAELQAAINPEIPPAPPRETEKPVTPPPEPQATPALKKPEAKPEAKPAAKPPVAREKRKDTRRAAVRGERNDSRSTSPASSAAGGLGRGRSEANSNYAGTVQSLIRRNLTYPEAARPAAGTASIAFALDGRGRVTSVRLTGSAGNAALDREATAVVRRASPFPAPPNGQAQSFTIPLRFRVP